MTKFVKVFGPGCLKCETLYENVKKAAEELGIETFIEKVQDIKQMALFGVFKTPGLWIDGQVVSQGEVLSVEEIKKLLSK
ncbi:thioredoxin family protein [Thermodesulfobacterium sp. TA1]|uniref:thioredoxin family protein n=1 Tax=Thermodesulfobacterium sp. TA1 TaxID=2234087 RepID=UPI00123278E5|nr:thioredoxin family protein [Thermodesulfobacterium sp. TA1]QER42109.1 thioredoxin family protein [Thermodesulfobacterium sp. TA1]